MTSNERRRRTLRGVGTIRPDDWNDPVDGSSEKNLRILEAVYHEAALIASDDPSPPTPDEIDDEDAIAAVVARLIGHRK